MGELTAAALAMALSRWFVWIGATGIIGSAGAHWLFSRPFGTLPDPIRLRFAARVARTAMSAAVVLAAGLALVLAAQLYSWFGVDGLTGRDQVAVMLGETRWGAEWLAVAQVAMVAIALAIVALFVTRARGGMLGFAAVLTAVSVPLLGHGGAHGTANWLAHAAHLGGAGLWLGSLAVLARATWVLWRDDSPSPADVAALLDAFSPLALSGAALAVTSGVYIAWLHVQPLAELWTTEYGRTLLLKLAAVAGVAALGWRNWRRVVPAITAPAGLHQIRQAVRLELSLALVGVLLLTAWLSGLPV